MSDKHKYSEHCLCDACNSAWQNALFAVFFGKKKKKKSKHKKKK